MKKAGLIALIAVGTVVFLGLSALGLILNLDRFAGILGIEKTFSFDELSVELDHSFIKVPVDGYEAALGNGDITLLFTRYRFSENENLAYISEGELAETLVSELDRTSGITVIGCSAESTPVYYDFVSEDDNGEKSATRAYVYKSDTSFWIVYFVPDDGDLSEYADEIESIAESVSFDK